MPNFLKKNLCTLNQMQYLILLRTSWWIKGWEEPFHYSFEDIHKNPVCLNWSSSPGSRLQTPHTQSSIEWSPPPMGFVKWNVDASLDPLRPKSAIGRVLRDQFVVFYPNKHGD